MDEDTDIFADADETTAAPTSTPIPETHAQPAGSHIPESQAAHMAPASLDQLSLRCSAEEAEAMQQQPGPGRAEGRPFQQTAAQSSGFWADLQDSETPSAPGSTADFARGSEATSGLLQAAGQETNGADTSRGPQQQIGSSPGAMQTDAADMASGAGEMCFKFATTYPLSAALSVPCFVLEGQWAPMHWDLLSCKAASAFPALMLMPQGVPLTMSRCCAQVKYSM